MREIELDGFNFMIDGEIIGLITKNKNDFNLNLKPLENKNDCLE